MDMRNVRIIIGICSGTKKEEANSNFGSYFINKIDPREPPHLRIADGPQARVFHPAEGWVEAGRALRHHVQVGPQQGIVQGQDPREADHPEGLGLEEGCGLIEAANPKSFRN